MGGSACGDRHGRRGCPRNAIAQQEVFSVETVAGIFRVLQPARADRLRDPSSVKKEAANDVAEVSRSATRRGSSVEPRQHLAQNAGRSLPGPKPPKCAGDQQAIDEAIEGFLEGHTPRLALPDAVDQGSQSESKERGGASDAKNRQIVRTGRNRVSREIGNEEADQQAIGKPHAEKLRHGGWGAGING